METREATKIVALYPRLDGKGHTSEEWEVGKKRKNPAGEWDVVSRIAICDHFRPHAEVCYKEFGEEWVMTNITHIYFENARSIQSRTSKKAGK
jgi:hypothetical protein